MKCDHLIGRTFDGIVYVEASEAMEAIAELKARLARAIAERDGNQVCIDALKAKLEDSGMENRRLRRALYKACANWAYWVDHALTTKFLCNNSSITKLERDRWYNMEHKCLKKMEEYK